MATSAEKKAQDAIDQARSEARTRDNAGGTGDYKGDAGASQVQEAMDEATAKGYIGQTPDPTPNKNYSLETGQDAPTPETDPKLAAKARKAQTETASGGDSK